MRILGVDPGLNTTGYAILDFEPAASRVVEAGVGRGKARTSVETRVREIHEGLSAVIADWNPETMALEKLYSHYTRPTTAFLLGHARGVFVLAASQADIPVEDYAATQVKKTLTGNGRAPKSQVQLAIQQQLALRALPEPPDVADALAIALCHGFAARDLAGAPNHAAPPP